MEITEEQKKTGAIQCQACKCIHWPSLKCLNKGEHFHCPSCNVPLYIQQPSQAALDVVVYRKG